MTAKAFTNPQPHAQRSRAHLLQTVALICGVLFFPSAVIAGTPPGYYDLATGKTGAELRQDLHQIVRNHHVIPYSSSTRLDTSDFLKILDLDPLNANNVVGIYSRESEPASTFGLTTGWNREHLWCDSYGLDGVEPAYSDLHNLRAEDANVNSSRGNKFYDNSDTNSPGYQMPAHAEAPLASTDTDSWEPPAFVKGDIARALFYMAVRYTGDVSNEPGLHLTDATDQIASTTNLMGRLSTLLRWNQADPVDAAELLRNDLIFSYQTNRNPFVDHPEFVAAAYVPLLSIARSGEGISLFWTNDSALSVSVETGGFGVGWVPVPNAPVLSLTNVWTVTLPLDPGIRLFRLRVQ